MTPDYILEAMETTISELTISRSPHLTVVSGTVFSGKTTMILGMACMSGRPESSMFVCTETPSQDIVSKLPKGFGVAVCFGEDYFMDLLEVYLGEESCVDKLFIEEVPRSIPLSDIKALAKRSNKQVFVGRSTAKEYTRG